MQERVRTHTYTQTLYSTPPYYFLLPSRSFDSFSAAQFLRPIANNQGSRFKIICEERLIFKD